MTKKPESLSFVRQPPFASAPIWMTLEGERVPIVGRREVSVIGEDDELVAGFAVPYRASKADAQRWVVDIVKPRVSFQLTRKFRTVIWDRDAGSR